MPPALADFFFIAGLKGHEPAIVKAGGTPLFRAEAVCEGSTLHETLLESHEDRNDDITVPTVVPPQPTPISNNISSTIDLPPTISESPPLLDVAVDNTSSGLFDDVLAKFSSERDDFVLSLAPLSVPPPTQRASSPLSPPLEEEEDCVGELNGSTPLRSRISFRTKISDLSRRASQRTGTLRRQNTNGISPFSD
jgi:hypothetical protein